MEMWFLGAYAVGTVFGLYLGYKTGVKQGAEVTIEMLCATKYLRFRKLKDGTVELLRLDEENLQENQ